MTLEALVSLAYRYRRSDIVSIETKRGKKERTVGLGQYRCSTCKPTEHSKRGCHRFGQSLIMKSGHWTIDYGAVQNETIFCPLSYNLESLANQVYQCVRIKDNGGLETYFKKPVGQLPRITVYFYQLVLSAERRFMRHKEDTADRLRQLARDRADGE